MSTKSTAIELPARPANLDAGLFRPTSTELVDDAREVTDAEVIPVLRWESGQDATVDLVWNVELGRFTVLADDEGWMCDGTNVGTDWVNAVALAHLVVNETLDKRAATI